MYIHMYIYINHILICSHMYMYIYIYMYFRLDGIGPMDHWTGFLGEPKIFQIEVIDNMKQG